MSRTGKFDGREMQQIRANPTPRDRRWIETMDSLATGASEDALKAELIKACETVMSDLARGLVYNGTGLGKIEKALAKVKGEST